MRTEAVHVRGAQNFRDLGGFPVADGRAVRPGLVFRMRAPHTLTPVDRDRCGQLGLQTGFDLRSPKERQQEPACLPLLRGVRVLETPLLSRSAFLADASARRDAVTVGGYGGILSVSAGTIGAILTALSDEGAVPAAFHCSAGDERTDVPAAVLLLALGATEGDVLDDFELASRHWSSEGSAGLHPEPAARPMERPRMALQRALRQEVGTDMGAVTYLRTLCYLKDKAGMADETIRQLRTNPTGDVDEWTQYTSERTPETCR